MSFLDVVFRALNKDGDGFIEQRREDGHGSASGTPTHVSAATLPLPDGAATAAKQLPNNHDVTVSASALPTGAATAEKQLPDNHQVTANAGTNLNTSALALESGGNLAALKARADLLATEATALATKNRADLLATEVTLLNVIAQQALMITALDDILTAAQAIAIDADSIAINADTINLNTDDLETAVGQVRDRLKLGQSTNAASSGVALSVEQEEILEALRDKDFATQTTLAAVLAKLIAAPATEAKQLPDNHQVTVSASALPSGAATDANISSRNNAFATLMHFLPDSTAKELRRDATLTDDYHGRAADGTATSAASWEVVRFYKTDGKIVRERYRSGVVWDDRAAGWS